MKFSLRLFVLCLLLSVTAVTARAESFQVDTLKPWQGTKVRFRDQVSLYVFRPEKPNGLSVVVCPGGSYFWLDRYTEGIEVGEWLSKHGITAFVLYYRTAGKGEFISNTRILFKWKRHLDMITDGQRALQWAWEHAEDYHIDRDKIGMMGFSAGGHLVMSCACFHTTNFLQAEGIQTQACLRPAFGAPVYPVVTMHKPYVHKRSQRGLLGNFRRNDKKMQDSLSLERHIPADCPPVFLINCVDDPVVDYHNSVLLDSALSAQSIPHRYLQYKRGKHGFGVSDHLGSPECRQWRTEFLSWLQGLYPQCRLDTLPTEAPND